MICFVQARMNSKRLPGKTMKIIKNKPVLFYVLSRLKKSKFLKKIVVLTSTKKTDNIIVKYCEDNNVQVFRGELNNVAKRFVKAIKYFKINSFVRITGDSPNIDPNLVDRLIFKFKKNNYDIVTNCKKKTFPKGQSIEVLNSKVFLKAFKILKRKKYLEHITNFFYDNEKKFKIYSFSNKIFYRKKNLSIDNHYDLKKFDRYLSRTRNLSLNWKKIYQKY